MNGAPVNDDVSLLAQLEHVGHDFDKLAARATHAVAELRAQSQSARDDVATWRGRFELSRVDAELARIDAREDLHDARLALEAQAMKLAKRLDDARTDAVDALRELRAALDDCLRHRPLLRHRVRGAVTTPVPWADLAETHSAIVVFAGDRAYKLKKPVTFDFLDFSTRERREEAAHREVALNRRLAPDVYLGVANVLDVDGAPCDHLVVMRRMPADRRLSALVAVGAATDGDLRDLARLLARFHAAAARTAATADAGSPGVIAAKLAIDVADLQAFRGGILPTDTLDEVAARATRYVDGRARLFEQRVEDGWVCDGHGDLLADDIFCLADGPRVLDCLDFSDELRYGDVLADVAFLAMDLEHRGVPALANRFLELYDEFSGERHPASLVDYYVAFRALIRAKVSALRAQQGDNDAPARARELLDLARGRLRHGRVALVLVGGAPGTGKSTVARGLATSRGWVALRSDVVRKELAGLDPYQHAPAALGEGLYTPAATSRAYEELLRRARIALELGESVVLDASWSDARWRADAEHVAAATASELVELRCNVDPSVAAARIERRRAKHDDPSDADRDVAAALRIGASPWPSATIVDTAGAVSEAVAEAVRATAAGATER
jgi:aminoglycoside phosphotransferase family enzyme/predicted kinase